MHTCTRFRTVKKVRGVRHVVKCRECGRKVMVRPMHAMATPKGVLP